MVASGQGPFPWAGFNRQKCPRMNYQHDLPDPNICMNYLHLGDDQERYCCLVPDSGRCKYSQRFCIGTYLCNHPDRDRYRFIIHMTY